METKHTSYYNWIPGCGEPTYSYDNLPDAEKEAERLSLKLKTKVITLAIVTTTEPAPKVVKISHDNLPF